MPTIENFDKLKKKISPSICVTIQDRPLRDTVVADISIDFGESVSGEEILQILDTLKIYGFDNNFYIYSGDCDILDNKCIPPSISIYGKKNKISKELLKKLKKERRIKICGEKKEWI